MTWSFPTLPPLTPSWTLTTTSPIQSMSATPPSMPSGQDSLLHQDWDAAIEHSSKLIGSGVYSLADANSTTPPTRPP